MDAEPLARQERAEIADRADNATAGPWEVAPLVDDDRPSGWRIKGPEYDSPNRRARFQDAAFIAAARTDVPKLLAALAKSEAQVAALHEALEGDFDGLVTAVRKMAAAARGREWVVDGRGCYEWDDDRYKAEAGEALREVMDVGQRAIVMSVGTRKLLADTAAAAEAFEKRLRLEGAALWRRQWEVLTDDYARTVAGFDKPAYVSAVLDEMEREAE